MCGTVGHKMSLIDKINHNNHFKDVLYSILKTTATYNSPSFSGLIDDK